MPPAARIGDTVLPTAPHRHAPIDHPAPMPVPYPAMPRAIIEGCPTVLVGKMPTVRVGDASLHASCVAPIPNPSGRALLPDRSTVIIGG